LTISHHTMMHNWNLEGDLSSINLLKVSSPEKNKLYVLALLVKRNRSELDLVLPVAGGL